MGAWCAADHGVTMSWTGLNNLTTTRTPEQKEYCRSYGGGVSSACGFPGIGTHSTQLPGQTYTHAHAHTHTHTHTHAHTRVPQVGVFIRKPERSTPGSMNCPKSWQDITSKRKEEKKCSENPVYNTAPKPSLKSFPIISGQSAGPCGILTEINELCPGSSETPGLQHRHAHYSWVIPAPSSALSLPSRGV